MAKFVEAHNRKLQDVFVCKKCKAKIRTPSLKVSQGKTSCRKCKSRKLRPKRRK